MSSQVSSPRKVERIQALCNYASTTTVNRLVAIVNGTAKYFNGMSWESYFDADITNPDELIDLVQLTDELYWSDTTEGGGSQQLRWSERFSHRW